MLKTCNEQGSKQYYFGTNHLAQMPKYVKFMKKIMSKKKNPDSVGTISISKNCSAIIQRKFPKKLRDPGSFTIPCVIGEHTLCNIPKYTLVVFNMFRVFCRYNLNFS